jgi:hypothetical protein
LRSVVAGFGQIINQNQQILTRAWIGGGRGIPFTGIIPVLVTITAGTWERVGIAASAGMLLVMGGFSAMTEI